MMSGVFEQLYLTGIPAKIKHRSEGKVEWECPSNIALVKYWGKKLNQLPANPSLSFTLSESYTNLLTAYSIDPGNDFKLDFYFDDKPDDLFRNRLAKYLRELRPYFPFLDHIHLKINSHNTFPHSSGIASSASFFGAVALTICSIEKQLMENHNFDGDFFRKASYFARLGSGSACRSVFGQLVLWGKVPDYPDSSDEIAIPLEFEMNPVYHDFRDSILVVSSSAKTVSSSAGHELMKNHAFYDCRIKQAGSNMQRVLNALQSGEINEFIDTIELESLTLHALMMASAPGYFLFRPQTIEIIERIKEFRKETVIPVGFSLDAGPNVHLLYPVSVEMKVHEFIDTELRSLCEKEQVIHDFVGKGPVFKKI